jgi:D-alanyl-D-alanine carboxypeptidase (penicillin-binding protein 5/6)
MMLSGGLKRFRETLWLLSIGLAGLMVARAPAFAAASVHRAHHHKHRAVATAGKQSAARGAAPLFTGSILEDADTGQVLYSLNADMPWPPASMAKMMLLLVAEDELDAGHCRLADPVRVSERAAMTGGSRVGLKAGDVYPLVELMKAALIKSANDAAVAIAEKVAGSIEGCVVKMNKRAENLYMTHTHYETVDGLPPRPTQDADRTDALDLAILGRALLKHPELLKWSGSEEAEFNNGECMLRNTNHLVGHFDGCDGLKTGFTTEAKFNVTATAKRGDTRLIAVILGAPSNAQRFEQAARVMQWGFDNFERVAILKQGQLLPVHVQIGTGALVQPVVASNLTMLLPKKRLQELKFDYDFPDAVGSSLPGGTPLGDVVVWDGSRQLAKVAGLVPPDLVGSSDAGTDGTMAGTSVVHDY